MTLEDFFTLTEMKNGLTTCARVEELICVMQKLNCAANNAGDAARQRSTAAKTLASTQNRECLTLFVHLNGLSFLNLWLQEAVKCSRDRFAEGEDLITALIESLDKLPIHHGKLSSSGILTTVEKLLGHTDGNIKESARKLFEKWSSRRDDDDNGWLEMERDGSYPIPSVDTPSMEFKHAAEEVVDNSSCRMADEGSRRKVKSGGRDDDLFRLGDEDDAKCSTPGQTSPAFSSGGNEHRATAEGSFIPEAEMPFSTAAAASPEIRGEEDSREEAKKGEGDSWEFLSVTSHTKNYRVIRSASCNLTLNEGKSILSDSKEALHRCASVDRVWPEYSKTMKEIESGEHDDCTDILGSNNGSSSDKEAAENTSDTDHCDNEAAFDTFIYDRSHEEMEKGSDSEPESGEMDALEIARMVAIEVEREVVDYREELCSSPEVSSNEEAMNTGSPSIEEEEEGERGRPMLEAANKDECDVAASSPKDEDHMFAEMAVRSSRQEQSLESPNGGGAVNPIQESRARAELGRFDFDLNEDASIEDIDCAVNPIHPYNLINLSAPIAVSASKGAPAFLIAPLCFEAGLGWKGSAATSAFRPASPRRAAFDGEKSESGSKYKPNLMELDLNVTDCGHYLPAEAPPTKEVPVSSGMPSWNSSSEVSSLRADRIKLDLNSNGEDEATPSQSHHLLNGGSSPASSSSPGQLPRKNFDLNDTLFSSDAVVFKSINPAKDPHRVRTDDPASASRMSADRRAHPNQTHQPYMGNGFSFDSTMPTGPILPYPHPSYGYMAPGAGMAIPFQPAVYGFGSIPHMVDSRGATVVPHLLASAGPNGAPLATLPYLMSITNGPSSSNGGGGGGGGAAQPGLDLNFGLMQMEGGGSSGAEMGNLKHPLMPLMEEQMNSGNSLKRKETESGWESYSFGYKHLASWHS